MISSPTQPLALSPKDVAASRAGWWRARELGVAVALLLEVALFALLVHQGGGTWAFVAPANLVDIVLNATVIGIAAIGATFVIIAGGIDLSVGGAIALCGVAAAGCLRGGHSVAFAVLFTLLVGVSVGAVAALLITRAHLAPFIATLALMLITRGIAFVFTGGANWPIDNPPFTEGFGNGALLGIPYPALLFAVLAVLATVCLGRSVWGRQIFAVGGNAVAARYAGVAVSRIEAGVYILSGLCAATAGLVYAARYGLGQSTAAMGYELDVVAASVVGGASLSGGRGSIGGAVMGALIFATLRKGLSQVEGGATYNDIIVGLVVIAAVLLDRFTQSRLGPSS